MILAIDIQAITELLNVTLWCPLDATELWAACSKYHRGMVLSATAAVLRNALPEKVQQVPLICFMLVACLFIQVFGYIQMFFSSCFCFDRVAFCNCSSTARSPYATSSVSSKALSQPEGAQNCSQAAQACACTSGGKSHYVQSRLFPRKHA